MQNLFIEENEEFTVTFTVATNDKGHMYCEVNKELLDMLIEGMGEFEINSYSATCRRPSFADAIGIYQSIFSVNATTGVEYNPVEAKYRKMVALLKDWNLTDGEGEKVDLTEQAIMKLNPLVANVIAVQIEIETGITE